MHTFPHHAQHRSAIAACLASLLAAGCTTVGPDYEKPAPTAPAVFQNATQDTSASTATAGEKNWWLLFGDAELDALETSALAQNQQLAAAVARVDEARARLGLAHAERSAALSTTSTAKLAGESAERTLPLPGRPVTYRERGDSYRVPFDAAYEVDLWGRVRRSIESAQAQSAASEHDLATARLTLTGEVAQTWFTRKALRAELAVVDRTLALRSDQLRLSESRYQAGLSNELDVQRNRLELATLEADRTDLIRRLTQTAHALAVLTGVPASSFAPADTAAPTLTAPPTVPVGLPSALLSRRPDILSAERQLAARTAEIGVARAAFFPTLRLTGSAGFESAELGQLLNHTSQFWQIGPSLSYTFIDGGRNKANLAAAQARAAAAHADYQQKILVAFREVEDALVDLHQQCEQAAALARAQTAADTSSQLLHSREDHGLVSHFEVIEAERTQLTLARTRTQLEGARHLATVRLIKALGGSWSATTPAP